MRIQTMFAFALLLVAVMMLYFLWQTGVFFWRNRPGDYRPDALPPQALP